MAKKTSIEFRTAFGAYNSDAILGEGGAGTVYRATDDQGQSVAIKLLDPGKATSQRLKRFKNEYLFSFRHQHEHLVKVLDFGIIDLPTGSAPFYVMPRYQQSLRKLLAADLTDSDRLAMFEQILSGVEAAHLLKVYHRDLKPENILANGPTDLVIADFGIAHFEVDDLLTAVETRQAERLANFMYAAPEQRSRGAAVDHRADIFALGLMLHELLAGVVPHGAGYRTIAEMRPALQWVDGVVSAMIQSDPAARPASVAAVRQLLRIHSDQFHSQQKLSALAREVVPAGEIEDPLATEPPVIVGVDYDRGTLVIQLDRSVGPDWMSAFHEMGNYSAVWGAEPHRFDFRGHEARVRVEGHEAQDVINHFKQWLPAVTRDYRRRLELEMRQAEAREREAIRLKREELERREQIRSSLRF